MILMLDTASIALEWGASEHETIAILLDASDRGSRWPRHGRKHPSEYYTESNRTPNLPGRHDRILHASSSLRLVSAPDKIYNVRSPLKDCRQLGDNVKTIVLDRGLTVWQKFEMLRYPENDMI